MKILNIIFDKYLIIPDDDFKVFKNENFVIDDGTYHLYDTENNVLLVLDSNKNPMFSINFEKKFIQKDMHHMIKSIKYRLKEDINPKENFKESIKKIKEFLYIVFKLLDDILYRRSKKSKNKNLVYKYIIYEEAYQIYDEIASLDGRFKYIEFLKDLEFIFTIYNS